MNIEREDRIHWYRSKQAQRDFPVYVFGGDTDMATQGKVSLTSVDSNEVVLVDATRIEINELLDPDGFEAQVNLMLDRKDLRLPRLREDPAHPSWHQPLDIYDPTQTVERKRVQSVSGFLRSGGRITGLGEPVTMGAKPMGVSSPYTRWFFALLSVILLMAGIWLAVRLGAGLQRGFEKYGFRHVYFWKSAQGWVDELALLVYVALFAACMSAAYWILCFSAGQERLRPGSAEGLLFYVALSISILAMSLAGYVL